MAEMMIWGFAIRFLVSLIQASPFILAGFMVAAVLRSFLATKIHAGCSAKGLVRPCFARGRSGCCCPSVRWGNPRHP
jgi:hypothetical protein